LGSGLFGSLKSGGFTDQPVDHHKTARLKIRVTADIIVLMKQLNQTTDSTFYGRCYSNAGETQARREIWLTSYCLETHGASLLSRMVRLSRWYNSLRKMKQQKETTKRLGPYPSPTIEMKVGGNVAIDAAINKPWCRPEKLS
jgi:hypothetical protein